MNRSNPSRSDQLIAGLIIAVLIGLWYAGKWVWEAITN